MTECTVLSQTIEEFHVDADGDGLPDAIGTIIRNRFDFDGDGVADEVRVTTTVPLDLVRDGLGGAILLEEEVRRPARNGCLEVVSHERRFVFDDL